MKAGKINNKNIRIALLIYYLNFIAASSTKTIMVLPGINGKTYLVPTQENYGVKMNILSSTMFSRIESIALQ